jgi:hypothetical protein
VTTPVSTPQSQPTTTTTAPANAAPTDDGEQEFGFER